MTRWKSFSGRLPPGLKTVSLTLTGGNTVASFLGNVAANLASNLLRALASGLRHLAFVDGESHALERVWETAFRRMGQEVTEGSDVKPLERVEFHRQGGQGPGVSSTAGRALNLPLWERGLRHSWMMPNLPRPYGVSWVVLCQASEPAEKDSTVNVEGWHEHRGLA